MRERPSASASGASGSKVVPVVLAAVLAVVVGSALLARPVLQRTAAHRSALRAEGLQAVEPDAAPRPGSYQGTADGQPFELRLLSVEGDRIEGEAIFPAGAATRRIPLVGRYDPASGELALSATSGRLIFRGQKRGATLGGAFIRGDHELTWSVAAP